MESGIDAGLLIIRVVVAGVMMFHGTQKLLGWWGGEGLDGTAAFFDRQGFRPPKVMAAIAGCIETIGGALFGMGLFVSIAAVLLISTLVNVVILHARNGLDRKKNGFEYELVLLAAVAGLALTGPGAYALDTLFRVDVAEFATHLVGLDTSIAWGAIMILAGAAGGIAVASTKRRKA